MREQVNFQWNDDEVRFALDQHAELDFYSVSSLNKQSETIHVAPLGHINLILSQPVFALPPLWYMLSGEATHTNFKVFGWTRRGSNPRSSDLRRARQPLRHRCGFNLMELSRKVKRWYRDRCITLLSFLEAVTSRWGLRYWCSIPLSTIFRFYHGGQFYW